MLIQALDLSQPQSRLVSSDGLEMSFWLDNGFSCIKQKGERQKEKVSTVVDLSIYTVHPRSFDTDCCWYYCQAEMTWKRQRAKVTRASSLARWLDGIEWTMEKWYFSHRLQCCNGQEKVRKWPVKGRLRRPVYSASANYNDDLLPEFPSFPLLSPSTLAIFRAKKVWAKRIRR